MRRWMMALGLAVAGPAAAQEVDTGEALFRAHCAACHGVDATGKGPLAAMLTVPVADLTVLAARNGGEFPLLDVIRTVDGRSILAAHGGPMPVFGPMTGGGSAVVDGPEGTVLETTGDIVKIAEYLATLQAE
ncbi:cytochrome c [Psychromarinibacter sp. C21-152]|uniref:Cytochrome c n=1 Tax=Psychromarinibacter sediminicola TaxID=3033385 RepID=A0AAE3NRI5_9RHOB|nr:cytochrome c [Psychromarinibacter sediminicola]MDF0600329.1 cytochrome c [Psychromarinibacter sediminicola]